MASSATPQFDPQLVAEFTRRGITEKKALELLANLKPGQDVVAQLEHTDHMVKNARFPITNPPGFYIRLIESNTSVPDGFETSAKRVARQQMEREERERRDAEDAHQILESEYYEYCSRETDQYVEENRAAFEVIVDAKRQETRAAHPNFSPEMTESIAVIAARRTIQKEIAEGLPFEDFAIKKQQGFDFLLKPVAVLADAPLVPVAPPHEDAVMTDDAVILRRRDSSRGERGAHSPGPRVGNGAGQSGNRHRRAVASTSDAPEPGDDAVDPAEPQDNPAYRLPKQGIRVWSRV